jgi:hypothetical protein
MYCCVECFNDDYLKKIIKQEGLRGNCYFCGSKNKMCIDPIKLYDYFQPVVDLYSPVENIMSTHDIKAGYGDFLENKLQEEWCIFSYNNCENYKEEKLATTTCIFNCSALAYLEIPSEFPLVRFLLLI